MFSGIILGLAKIVDVKNEWGILKYAVKLPDEWLEGLKNGASVAVDGICQTVVKIDQNCVYFDAIEETLKRTTINGLKVGEKVNIERSLRYGDEIGGHLLSGHVYGTATIGMINRKGNNVEMRIDCSSKWMKYLFEKGFIAVDGASLTVVDVDPTGHFTVHLIPETLRLTTLGFKREGDPVNLEFDSQTQTIVHAVEKYLSRIKPRKRS